MPPYVQPPTGNTPPAPNSPSAINYRPPQSLSEGNVGYSWGSYDSLAQVETLETIPPVLIAAGQQFAVSQARPVFGGNAGRAVTYETTWDVIPGAAKVELQGAMRDVDGDYQTIDDNSTVAPTSTDGLSIAKTVAGVKYNFLRIALITLTAGNATKWAAKILA